MDEYLETQTKALYERAQDYSNEILKPSLFWSEIAATLKAVYEQGKRDTQEKV